MSPRISNITQTNCEPRSCSDMVEAEYDELRGIAAARMREERLNHTLTGTALAHEVAARMLTNSQTPATNRGQFLAFANKAMRNYLIDYARARRREKRGGDRQKFAIHEADAPALVDETEQLEALQDVLKRLSEIDKRRAKVVRLRYVDGCSNEEVAEKLQTSVATVKRDWIVARAWLANELKN